MARKGLSTRPPSPSVVPLPPLPRSIEAADAAPPIVTVPPPPLPPPVDLMASAAFAQLAAENAALREQIADMTATMTRLRREVMTASEGELVELALSIAERVVGRELQSDPVLVVAWAHEAIDALGAKDGVVIATARDVRERAPADAWAAIGIEHRLQTDAQLGPGVVEVRTPEGTVVTGAEARLAAVGHALGIETS
jgi:flagellar biosynthesis/type III secretory pathway protein FliH